MLEYSTDKNFSFYSIGQGRNVIKYFNIFIVTKKDIHNILKASRIPKSVRPEEDLYPYTHSIYKCIPRTEYMCFVVGKVQSLSKYR